MAVAVALVVALAVALAVALVVAVASLAIARPSSMVGLHVGLGRLLSISSAQEP